MCGRPPGSRRLCEEVAKEILKTTYQRVSACRLPIVRFMPGMESNLRKMTRKMYGCCGHIVNNKPVKEFTTAKRTNKPRQSPAGIRAQSIEREVNNEYSEVTCSVCGGTGCTSSIGKINNRIQSSLKAEYKTKPLCDRLFRSLCAWPDSNRISRRFFRRVKLRMSKR